MEAGFADPVHGSQACFRAVLDAMARPGTIHAVAGVVPPAGLDAATAAVLLTLVDLETPLWIDPVFAAAAAWIGFHCSAPLVALGHAGFVLASALPKIGSVGAGSDDAPEDGATVVLQVASLGSGSAFVLEGPGLAGPAVFRAGLPAGFAAYSAGNQARFPRGFDLVLCAGDQLAALPRSVHVREG